MRFVDVYKRQVVFNEDIDNIKGTTLEELFIKEGGDYE